MGNTTDGFVILSDSGKCPSSTKVPPNYSVGSKKHLKFVQICELLSHDLLAFLAYVQINVARRVNIGMAQPALDLFNIPANIK